MLNKLIRCLADIKQGRAGFETLPAAFWDSEIYGSLVYFDWRALQFIAEEDVTAEIVAIAMDQSALALQFVPRALKSAGICERAVRSEEGAIAFVPPELASETMYAHWIGHLETSGFPDPDCLQEVPLRFRNEVICTAAVRLNAGNIFAVPPSMHTPQVVAAYLESECGDIYIEDLPKQLRTVPLCCALLERGLGELKDVPDDVRALLPQSPRVAGG